MLKRMVHGIVLAMMVAGFTLAGPKQTAHADGTTWTVDSLADAAADGICGNVPGDCTLRDAIALADVSGDTINFSVVGPIILTQGEFNITKDLTISGPGAGSLTISGGNVTRVFNIATSTVTVSISGLTISDGFVTDANGGGISNSGTLILDQVVVNNNAAHESGIPSGHFTKGGGIYNSKSTTITNSQITNNNADYYGGGIFSDTNSSLSITNSIISDNEVYGSGGAGFGGGFAAINADSVILDSDLMTSNAALYGGAMYSNSVTTLTITNSLISNNEAKNGAGGLYLSGSDGTDTVENTTISGNHQSLAGSGVAGGIWADAASLMTINLNHLTITNNSVEGTGGGGGIYAVGAAKTPGIRNSIVAGNTTPNSSDVDCAGIISSLDYNLIEDVTGCTIAGTFANNITGTDPLLDPLADNGGSTQTHFLHFGSPAIDAIPSGSGGCGTTFTTDQRGATRPMDGNFDSTDACDMGAFEKDGFQTSTIYGLSSDDGWILESSENSGKGGTLNNNQTTLRIGDDASNKQYRAILSFLTSSLPAGSTIDGVTLMFKYAGKSGALPFGTHGNLLADMRTGVFGSSNALQIKDFNASASKSKVLSFNSTKVNGWYSKPLSPADLSRINLAGITQFRLRFTLDDNNDSGADFLKIYSGDTSAAKRPQLIIDYHVP